MTGETPNRPDALAAFSTVLLMHEGRYLLLRRAETKRFAPGRWTGLGGRVEPGELGDLGAAALRELLEETGIAPKDVDGFALRRALLHNRPGAPLTVLLYFTGRLRQAVTPPSPEGAPRWVSAAELGQLDVIENTALVLPLLIEDLTRDPQAREPVRVGAAHYGVDGELDRIAWA